MNTTTQPPRTPQSTWGRSPRLGGGSGRLIAVSVLLGVAAAAVLAAGATALAQAFSPAMADPWTWLFPLIFFVVAAPTLAMGAWALLVDRSTVRGATARPEESIENRWYDRAAQSAFHIMFPAIGISAALASITRWQMDTGLLLMAVAVVMVLVFALSYLWARLADS